MYAADTRAGHIRAFKVADDDTLTNDRVFATCPRVGNIRFDDEGRL